MKTLIKHIILFLLFLSICTANSIAQEFKIINKIPHLPVYATNGSVPSPTTGMMIFNQATARSEIYTGSGWVSFANAELINSTSEDFLAVKDGIPIIPAFDGEKSSDPGTVPKGTIFYDTSAEEIRMWDGTAWHNLFDLSTSESLTAGNSFELNSIVDGIQLPMLASDPSGCEEGAIYFNITDKLITTFDGTDWNNYSINMVPQASNVSQSGNLWPGQVLSGSYLYSDNELDPEGTSTFKWYTSASSDGSSPTVISGATSSTYTILAGDLGKYIGFAVIPVATSGESPGVESIAETFTGPVGSNDPPVASSVSQSGTTLEPGFDITGSYTYSDADNDDEGASLFKWYRADDASGTNEILLFEASPSNLSFTLLSEHGGYYFRFAVIPVAATGSSPGSEVISSTYIGPIVTNAAPIASNVSQSGSIMKGDQLSGSYNYSDADGDSEGSSIYKWYTSSSSTGSSPSLIGGATSSSYTTGDDDLGLYIGFSVTPVASSGTSPGTEVISSTFSGPITSTWVCGGNLQASHTAGAVAPETVSITYQTGTESASTKCWIKQNLGAAAPITDAWTPAGTSNFGWFWQFNRQQGYIADSDWGGVSINENSVWTSANDPCSLLLGAAWRLPTLSEWGELQFSNPFQDNPYWNNLYPYDAGYLDYSSQIQISGTVANGSGIYPNTKYWSNQQSSNSEGVYNTAQMPGTSLSMTKNNALPVRCLKD